MVSYGDNMSEDQFVPIKRSHVLLERIVAQNELILKQMIESNKNLAIVGGALLKMTEGKKKVVDKVK